MNKSAGLTVDQFQRRTIMVEYNRASLKKALRAVKRFAVTESLDAHYQSAAMRNNGQTFHSRTMKELISNKPNVVTGICVCLAAAALLSCGKQDSSRSSPKVETEVRSAWEEYKDASLSNKGEVAANRVTKAVFEYYDEIRRLALAADPTDLNAMTLAKRMTVLGMRLRMTTSELESMTGRSLFVHAVDRGWIGKNTATDAGIGRIMVTGDHARAEATKGSEAAGVYYHFIKEDGIWRLDMMQMLSLANTAFDHLRRRSGLSEDEFVVRTLESISGKKVTSELWNPPVRVAK